uniref:Uncharacterized protein n=1 Tax=Bactrocera latifrons TaxID=174628 RepID=A0A0K8U2U2_BACLA
MTAVTANAINKAGAAILPPQPYEITPPNPGEPTALQRLAALSAAAVAHDRENDRESDSESDSAYSASDDSTDSDTDIDDSDFVTFSLPFRARCSTLPTALEGRKLAEVAKSAVRKMWSRRIRNRSICN